MTIGPVAIDRVGSARFMPALFDDSYIEPLRAFIDELHRETDTAVGTQLFHMGRYAYSAITGLTPIAPSPVPSRLTGDTPREMSMEDIDEVQEAFAQAARRAKEAGFDYVELVGCTGYLISQFLSPFTNKRTDEYGGPIENRMRFGIETIKRARAAVGDSLALGIRIAGNDFMEGGHTNVEAALFAAACEEAGINAINVTGGWHETNVPQLTTNVPPGVFAYLARGIKQNVGIPVFASNRLGDPYLAERVLRAKSADMICWARPLICDPELPNKVKGGRLDEIVSCIACNQGCFDSVFSGQSIHCILNPRAGREGEVSVTPAEVKKKVYVAGGGPAGMECALTAQKRGHDVTLFEKEKTLGGQVNLAKTPPGKSELGKITESYHNRMKKAGVVIRLDTPLTPDIVEKEKPDVVIVASGAKPMEIDVPGIKKSHVIGAWDVLLGEIPDIGDDIVIIGGSATGCETAHFLAALGTPDPETVSFLLYHSAEDPTFLTDLVHNSGKNITVIDMVERLADNVSRTARWSLMKSLRLFGIDLRPKAKLIEITDDAVIVESDRGKEKIPADTVILAVGAKSEDGLLGMIEKTGAHVLVIGDAKEPRKITDAIREGFETAISL
jgi:2,4-dienoyl-CoA reductase (NADPH2)